MSIFEEAKSLYGEIVGHRRYIHQNAEISLDLPVTSAYVKEKLRAMGYQPMDVGPCGVVAIAGGKKPGKTFLLRADMDALPIEEINDLPFKSKTGNMHACGHDFHAAMLLGAAQILKNHEDEIRGQVKLMFQPAEETLLGAKAMIEAGVLENPNVDAAMMIHVVAGMEVPTGVVVFLDGAAPASDWFEIKVQGKGCHGAMSNAGVDPITVLAHTLIALQAINAREVAPNEPLSLTAGKMHAGTAGNVIPDTGFMEGTIRTFSGETREFVKQRVIEIAQGVAQTFRATAEVNYTMGCPVLRGDGALREQLLAYTQSVFGGMAVDMSKMKNKPSAGMGSEDFAFVSDRVPSVMVSLGAGAPSEGHSFPLHHSRATFNENALPVGAAVYANAALMWLANNP